MRFEQQITVNAPAQDVFNFVSDFANHAAWSSHDLKVPEGGGTSASVGATFNTEASQFGTQKETSRVVQADAPKTFAWESTGGLGTVRHTFSMDERDGGTVVTKASEWVKKSFLAKVMGFRIRKEQPKYLASDLEKIKAAIESNR